MLRKSKVPHIRYLSFLGHITAILAINNLCHSNKPFPFQSIFCRYLARAVKKSYTFIIIIFFVTYHIGFLEYKVNGDAYAYIPTPLVVVDVLVDQFLHLSNILSVTYGKFWGQVQFKEIEMLFLKLDRRLDKLGLIRWDTPVEYYAEFVMLTLFIIIVCTYDMYNWYSIATAKDLTYYILDYSLRYHFNVFLFFVFNVLRSIMLRIRCLNLIIRKENITLNETVLRLHWNQLLCESNKILSILQSLLYLFTDLYGWHIWCIVLYTLLTLLHTTSYIFMASFDIKTEDKRYDYHIIAVTLLWCVLTLVS